MAKFTFNLPDIGEGIAEAEIVAWHVSVGDVVEEDQQIADMMTDKATVEMESPVAGKVIEVAGEVGDTIAIGFDAYAIGGLSVGEPSPVMYDIAAQTALLLPPDRPRYLMGIGMPDDLVEAVACGIDLFDCVLPTRNARNGQLFTACGPISIKGAAYAEDDRPVDESCRCYTCKHFSRAYLRHLYLANEITAATLNTLHNLHFYLDTIRRIREAIVFGSFEVFRHAFHRTYSRRPRLTPGD